MADQLRALVPEATLAVAHGQTGGTRAGNGHAGLHAPPGECAAVLGHYRVRARYPDRQHDYH